MESDKDEEKNGDDGVDDKKRRFINLMCTASPSDPVSKMGKLNFANEVAANNGVHIGTTSIQRFKMMNNLMARRV